MKTMKLLFLCMLTTALISCSTENSEDEIDIDELVGSWKATTFTMINKSNSSETFEFVSNGGEVRFTVLTGGRVRTWMDLGDFSDEWDAILSIKGNTLTATPAESTRETLVFTIEMNTAGNIVTLTNDNDAFDFTLTGNPDVPAVSVGVYARQ